MIATALAKGIRCVLAVCGVAMFSMACGSKTTSPSHEDGGVLPGAAGDGAGSGAASGHGGAGGAGDASEFDCGLETCAPGQKCCPTSGRCFDPNSGAGCTGVGCASTGGAPLDLDACCGPLGLVGCPTKGTCVHPDCAECCPPDIECNQHDECPDGYSCCYGTRRCYHPAVEDCPNITPPCDDRGDCPGDLTCSTEYDVCYPPGPHPGLAWHWTCGYPVCGIEPDVVDDPETPNCTTEQEGDACMVPGAVCDGVASCGMTLACNDHGPENCPISRARYKQDIEYVGDEERRAIAERLLSVPLASYSYKQDPLAVPQLGFIIDDIEPSAAVRGDHVNLYGYLSMAVATIQVQDQQLRALQHEVEQLKRQLDPSTTPQCVP